jgi:hypothetical protein
MNAPPNTLNTNTNVSITGGAVYRKPKTMWDAFMNMMVFLNDKVMAMNNSKIFAGVIIIVMNIASKFVVFKLSKSMEAYLKYTFSRDILVFAMAWMGTRDIYVALLITALFIVFVKYLWNEESPLCCLSEKFTSYHAELEKERETITEQQIKEANELLERAKKQKEEKESIANMTATQDRAYIPPHLMKVDRSISRNLLLDDEPYHPWV